MMPNIALMSVVGEQQYERRVVATDDFNSYANGSLPTVTGGKWKYNFAWYGEGSIVSGQAIGGGNNNGASRYQHSSFSPDQYSEITITDLSASGYYRGAAVRISNDNDDSGDTTRDQYHVDFYDNVPGSGVANTPPAAIRKIVNGTVTNLWEGQMPTVRTGDKLRLEVVGSNLVAYHNGVRFASAVDYSLTSGRPGFSGRLYVDAWEGGNIVPITPKVPLLRSRSRSIARAEMPQSSVQLAPEFDTPYAAGFFPSLYGLNNAFGGQSGRWDFVQIKATAGAARMTEGGMRFYADHGGEDDDRLAFSLSNVPTGRRDSVGGGLLTSVVVFKAWRQGASTGSQYVFRAGGHAVVPSNDNINLGWVGGNGYDYYGATGLNLLDGAWHTVVQSTKHNTVPNVSVDGAGPPASWTGQVWYVGDSNSTIGARNAVNINGNSGYTNYYQLDGIVRLAITLPGVFLDQARVQEVAKNPWQIFAPRRRVWVAGTEPPPKPLTVRREGRRATGQPQVEPQIDWGNPITRGLLVAATPFSRFSQQPQTMPFRDGVACRDGVLTGPAITHGVANSTVVSVDAALTPDNGSWWSNGSQVYGDTNQDWPNDRGLFWYSTSAYGNAHVGARATDGVFRNASISVIDGSLFPANSKRVLVRGATIDADLLVSAWGNGRFAGTSTALQGIGYDPPLSSYAPPMFGTSQPATPDSVTWTGLALRWGRALTPAEMVSITTNPWQVFKRGDRKFIFDAVTVLTPDLEPRYGRPISTAEAGAWSAVGAATHHEAINEVDADDNDYISVGAPGEIIKFPLTVMGDPGNTLHMLMVRAASTFSNSARFSIRQGATTELAAWTQAVTATPTQYDFALTTGERDSITDYTTLQLWIESL